MSFDFITARVVGLTTPIGIENINSSEEFMAYCARVSNPDNQNNALTSGRLLAYLMRNNHWSPFEMAHAVIEVKVPRDIARQLLRHRSFSFQEFSQRYAVSSQFILREARLQDEKNRQNSLETDDEDLALWFENAQMEVIELTSRIYKEALSKGIAKEQARCVLPEGLTMSTLYVSGTIRSWLHYIGLRKENGTQKEHRDMAVKCGYALAKHIPTMFNVE